MQKSKSNYSTTILTLRLNVDLANKLEALADDKKMPKSMLAKEIITKYLKEDYEDYNILSKSILKLDKTVQDSNRSTEFLLQLFYFWLNYFFQSHPKAENTKIVQDAKKRRDDFMNYFVNELFNENKTLFEQLLSKMNEKKESDNE